MPLAKCKNAHHNPTNPKLTNINLKPNSTNCNPNSNLNLWNIVLSLLCNLLEFGTTVWSFDHKTVPHFIQIRKSAKLSKMII